MHLIKSGEIMVEETEIFIEPSNLTQKLSRNTKGIMISISILVVFASIATIGTIIDEWITMTLGYVIAGISSVTYLVFFILFIANTKKLGRIEKQLSTITNWIFTSFLYAFIFTLAGFSSIYGSIMDGDPLFYISRIYGFIALFFYISLFISIQKLFTKLSTLKLYPRKERKINLIVIMLCVIFLMEVIDTILRPVIFHSYTRRGYSEEAFVSGFNRPLTWGILVMLIITIGIVCYGLNKLSNKWTEIDNEINTKYFQLPPKSFNDKFVNNNLMLYISFAMAIFLSIFYVLGHIITKTASGEYEQFGFSVGPFVGIAVAVMIFYLIKITLKYQKVSQLSKKTANYGILISILTSLSPFILAAGFFFNVTFEIIDSELFLTSRILLFFGILLFTAGAFLIYKTVRGLKEEEETEKTFIEKAFDLLLPLSGLLSAIVVVIDTIVRQVIWSTYIGTGEFEWSNLRKYQNDYLWLGYIFAALYSIALISVIYGLRKTEKEILDLLPNYGRIPVKLKKAKVVVQPTIMPKPVEKLVKAEIKPKIGHCSSCGEKIDERFRFCPFCGAQETGKEVIPKGKFCANCGDTVEKSFRFCPSCGVQFE